MHGRPPNFIHRRPRRGFSLIELISVISLVAIIGVAIAGPTLTYMSKIRSRSAATRILADIRDVQRYAMNSRLRTWIVFSTASNNYRLYAETSPGAGKATRVALTHPLDQTTSAVQMGSGTNLAVSISAVSINSTSEIEFDSWGKPYDGNSVALAATGTVTLSNGVTLTVQPVSGLVEQAG